MQDTDATTITSRRVSSAEVAEWRRRSISSFTEESFSMYVSDDGDVGLRLVIVVVADEVLDAVVGEELAELVGQLGGQRLVGGDDQRGLLHLLDRPGHRGALAGTGDAEQRLVALAVGDALAERGDGPRLVAGRIELGHHLEGDALQGHRRSTVPAGCDIPAGRGRRWWCVSLGPAQLQVRRSQPAGPAPGGTTRWNPGATRYTPLPRGRQQPSSLPSRRVEEASCTPD